MLFGAPVKSADDIESLKALGFDFGEVAIPNTKSRRMWWESGIKSNFSDGFFLIGHGPPVEEPFDDVPYLWNKYLPALMATVDTACRMEIGLLTVHMCMDSRFIEPLVLTEKCRALKELVAYGRRNKVVICLENLTESTEDLGTVMEGVPDLALTLDVGHGQLLAPVNTSFEIISSLSRVIRHVHLHDNRGGDSLKDDLHLPIGAGIIDFPAILTALIRAGYDGTVTLELKPEHLLSSQDRIQRMIEEISREPI